MTTDYRPDLQVCNYTWWASFLYLPQILPGKFTYNCAPWNWSTAVGMYIDLRRHFCHLLFSTLSFFLFLILDMQFYVISPLFILAYRRSKLIGWMTAVLSYFASLVYTAFVVLNNDIPVQLPVVSPDHYSMDKY